MHGQLLKLQCAPQASLCRNSSSVASIADDPKEVGLHAKQANELQLTNKRNQTGEAHALPGISSENRMRPPKYEA